MEWKKFREWRNANGMILSMLYLFLYSRSLLASPAEMLGIELIE